MDQREEQRADDHKKVAENGLNATDVERRQSMRLLMSSLIDRVVF